VDSSPAVADGKVFVGSGFWDNKIYCLGEDNGNVIWNYETGFNTYACSYACSGMYSSPAVAGGKVFISFNDGKIYCFGGKEQLTSAASTFSSGEACVYLHGDKTDVIVGEEAILSLSAVNLITKPTMTLQLILKVPSGMSITSTEFIESGAGQYTATYTVEPGKERHIGVNIKTNEPGDFAVVGIIAYYFRGDKSNAAYEEKTLPVKVNPKSTPTLTVTTPMPCPTETPGFEAIFAIAALLAVAYLVRRRK
jgi:PGF-CTERM protein